MSEGRFAENIVHFANLLRRSGLPVGSAAVVDGIRAVSLLRLENREDLYWALHAVFVTRHEQHPVFEQAFRFFWRHPDKRTIGSTTEDGDDAEARQVPPAARRLAGAVLPPVPSEAGRRAAVEIDASGSASPTESLRRRDFAQMSAAEIEAAIDAIGRLRLPTDRIRTRRSLASSRPGRIDRRRTMRSGLRTAGDMILLRYGRPRTVHPPVVVLCDISGSMAAYTRVLLHFFHALGERRRVHTFLFGTRLTNATRQLRRRDVDEALAACSATVADWSGGTRIADALHTFNRDWARRVLGQGAIVLLVTDGLERGDVAELGREMGLLHRSCRRLVWLNPLLGFDGFTAKARGIRAMLPHVDEFRPIHSLEAVADICRVLSEPFAATPRRLAA